VLGPLHEGTDRAQRKATKLADHRNDSKWETLVQSRKRARICTRENGLGKL
jgi:hypothetical protein